MPKKRIRFHDEDGHELQVDDDFGVPIPGLPLAPEHWARTGIKQLPPPGPVEWSAWFGRVAPVVLELGCGNGRYTIASAMQRPQVDHVGLDSLPLVIRYATRRANQRGLHNVRMLVSGAYEFLDVYVAPGSVAEIHLYHPQPFREKRRELAEKRLVSPAFLARVHRALHAGSSTSDASAATRVFVIQTDNRPYWNYIRRVAPEFFEFTEHATPWPDAPHGRTRREIYARQQQMPVYRATARPRRDLSEERISELGATLPLPNFDAGK